ncbi:MAG: hypothetical protein IPJ34_08030 [Myxococcales bacterium]|nr:hypothetical protein [Myxococcales bacterium]
MANREGSGLDLRDLIRDDAYAQLRSRRRALRHGDTASLQDLYADYLAHADDLEPSHGKAA